MSEMTMLNDPPHLAPEGEVITDPSPAQVASMLAGTAGDPPQVDAIAGPLVVDLPAGYITNGVLFNVAQVRELNGYDEEHMSRVDVQRNVGTYITDLLFLAVVEIGGEKPTKDVVRSLLIGDRDALVLGIRKASYGSHVKFTLTCSSCANLSDVDIDLDEDVPTSKLDDPMTRRFDVELRNGRASVALLNGAAQEAFSDNLLKRTPAETSSIMLAKSVIDINGQPTYGDENAVRALSSADRATLIDFIFEKQPGPRLGAIPVNCATCGEEYPISLGFPDLFRF